jgi:hypothetical protein
MGDMIIHLLNILVMVLGIILIFLAVIVWSMFRNFSSAALALTSLFVYVWVAVGLLDFYRIIDTNHILLFKGIPLLHYVPTLLMLLSLIFTLFQFYREQKLLK